MELDWNADLVYRMIQNMEDGQESIDIDGDISDQEEDFPLTRTQVNYLEVEEFVLPVRHSDMDGQNPDPLNTVEDSEIEVVFDSTMKSSMPPLIPLVVPGHDPSKLMKQKKQSSVNFQPASKKVFVNDSQESKYSKLVKGLQSLLECPVCSNMIRTAPVHSCSNGHLTCLPCWTRCHLCPVCRVPCHSTTPCFSQAASGIIELIPLPCGYRDMGCSVVGNGGEIAVHQLDCPYGVEEEQREGCPVLGCRVGH
eukprot:GFUD01038114.1.p1 GENE.GFUD01038114.1~~GFUD01038114.1.p1  ORF type:complete len:252 (-),score=56.71 GFUD01038114.1:16-771(-)